MSNHYTIEMDVSGDPADCLAAVTAALPGLTTAVEASAHPLGPALVVDASSVTATVVYSVVGINKDNNWVSVHHVSTPTPEDAAEKCRTDFPDEFVVQVFVGTLTGVL